VPGPDPTVRTRPLAPERSEEERASREVARRPLQDPRGVRPARRLPRPPTEHFLLPDCGLACRSAVPCPLALRAVLSGDPVQGPHPPPRAPRDHARVSDQSPRACSTPSRLGSSALGSSETGAVSSATRLVQRGRSRRLSARGASLLLRPRRHRRELLRRPRSRDGGLTESQSAPAQYRTACSLRRPLRQRSMRILLSRSHQTWSCERTSFELSPARRPVGPRTGPMAEGGIHPTTCGVGHQHRDRPRLPRTLIICVFFGSRSMRPSCSVLTQTS